MEDELRGRVDVAERAAAAAGHPELEVEEAQWENRMAKLRRRDNAILQGQVWAPNPPNLGGSGIQRQELRINGLGLQGDEGVALPFRDAPRGADPIFFDDLRGISLNSRGNSTFYHQQLASAYKCYEATYRVFGGKNGQSRRQRF